MSRPNAARGAVLPLILTLIGAPVDAGPTSTRWAAPVSGALSDPSNWEGGVAPSSSVGAIIDAVGSPYVVHWGLQPAALRSILLDSPDARLFAQSPNNSTIFNVGEELRVRRGHLSMNGRFAGGPVRVGAEGSFTVFSTGSLFPYPGAVLSMDVENDGVMTLQGDTVVTQGLGGSGPVPDDRRITNSSDATLRFEGGNAFVVGTIDNYGLLDVVNDSQFDGAGSTSLDVDGSAIGYVSNTIAAPAVLNNHGVVAVRQRTLQVDGGGVHSGRFELLSLDALLRFRGSHTFLEGATVTGPGLTRLVDPMTMSGSFSIEGDLALQRASNDASAMDLALDVSGDLLFEDLGALTFARDVRAATIRNASDGYWTFQGDADLVFDDLYRSAEFFGDAIIRGDHLGGQSVFHASARIMGSVQRSEFLDAATIDGDASEVAFAHGAEIGGDLTRGAQGVGVIAVGGDLVATTGAWEFSTPLGSPSRTRLDVAGDAEITRPFTMQGDLIVGGSLSAVGGRFENITADTIRFGAADPLAAAPVRLRDGSIVTSLAGPTRIENTVIRTDPTGGAFGGEEIVFASGLEMFGDNAGLAAIVNPALADATTFTVLADSSIAGRLTVAVFGDPAALEVGDAFALLDARLPDGARGDVPTITGTFGELLLPDLSNGMFFDVVYEPHAVRLVVIPAPAGVLPFALAFGLRRRARLGSLAV